MLPKCLLSCLQEVSIGLCLELDECIPHSVSLRYILMPFRLFLVLAVVCLVHGVVQELRMRFSVPFVLCARFVLFG
jgi:hypothetical protein